jgi:hypothetical protein
MFTKKRQFWLKTSVRLPGDGGEVEIHPFSVLVRLLTRSELDALKGTDLELVRAVAVDWKDVPDDEGNAVPFSAEALKALDEEWPTACGCIFADYGRAHAQAREKN